jgi:hypothetical protein
MTENEIIIADGFSDEEYIAMLQSSIRYALISKPFTIRRIGNQSLEQAILNIFKGKLAEELFCGFCHENNIAIDRKTCETAFWKTDRRDFIMNGMEWDIKNNFIYHPGDVLTAYPYTHLPALIPNRRPGDQWDSRDEIKNPGVSHGVGFVFTFLKAADTRDEKAAPRFFNFRITPEQKEYIEALEAKHRGIPATHPPFSEEKFWETMADQGPLDFVSLNFRPHLVITGYAGNSGWNWFKNTGPGDTHFHYHDYLKKGWYAKNDRGSCNFLHDTLWTTITNATVPVGHLPSFLSLFPHLTVRIKKGRINSSPVATASAYPGGVA